MTYQEILSYMYGLGRFGMKPGHERIRTILKALSDPQDGLQVIHVAGTNGKGSTAAFLAAILDSGGYKTGLFTSPHLIAFPERIRINGNEIAEDDVVSLADRIISVSPQESTFFEIVTALAYLYFAEQGVGPAVMEVGMGGRLDATTIASGMLSVITQIAMDHCEHLGDSISLIAAEKAGAIKSGKPVVTVPQSDDALAVIRNSCASTGSPLYIGGLDFSASWRNGRLDYQGIAWDLQNLLPGIPGRYQAMNAAAALCATELLDRHGLCVTPEAVRRGIEQASWPGRMELFPGSPRILLDGAHNPAGIAALIESLADFPRNNLIVIVGVVGDKDADGIIAPLVRIADRLIAVGPSVQRGMPAAMLAERCRVSGHEATAAGSVLEGLETALTVAQPDDLIVVCGSLFTVGEARAYLVEQNFEPFRG